MRNQKETIKIPKIPFFIQFTPEAVTLEHYRHFEINRTYIATRLLYDRVKCMTVIKLLDSNELIEYREDCIILFTMTLPN